MKNIGAGGNGGVFRGSDRAENGDVPNGLSMPRESVPAEQVGTLSATGAKMAGAENVRGGEERLRLRLRVRGAVQGVGFRPFVYRLATELGLPGWVNNSSQGVLVEVEGAAET